GPHHPRSLLLPAPAPAAKAGAAADPPPRTSCSGPAASPPPGCSRPAPPGAAPAPPPPSPAPAPPAPAPPAPTPAGGLPCCSPSSSSRCLMGAGPQHADICRAVPAIPAEPAGLVVDTGRHLPHLGPQPLVFALELLQQR